MDLMDRLNELNNMRWHDMLESGNLETLASEAYSLHQQLNLSDSQYIKNQKFCDFEIDYNQVEKDRLKPVRDGIERPIPRGAENAELDVFRFGTEGQVVEFVKQSLNLKLCLPIHNLQVPGKIYSVHIDYNRVLFRLFAKEQTQDIVAKGIKKFIWFLEDQCTGQFFGVGRECLTWKAGDIVSWPWYMPHGTANASSQDRPIIMICGI